MNLFNYEMDDISLIGLQISLKGLEEVSSGDYDFLIIFLLIFIISFIFLFSYIINILDFFLIFYLIKKN
jgi:hypothetical protein